MKIGILTLPSIPTTGGILQAYALQTVLERMGHEVCLIEKKKGNHFGFHYGKRHWFMANAC